jgi:hypothetical protein
MENESNKDISQDEKKIDHLLKKMADVYNKQKNIPNRKNINVHTLNSHIEEYLNTYLIIGYDINDNYIQMSNISSQGQLDKIQSAIHRVLRYGPGAKTGISDYDDI